MSDHPLFLIVVFDGLRPDMVTPELAPNLCRFMAEGVNFENARAVFPTSTRTNAAALATGSTPRRNGIVQNKYFDPNIFHDRIFRPFKTQDIEAGMVAYNGKLLSAPSLSDIVASAGYTMATFLSGSCGTARLIDPCARERGHINLGFIDWEDSCPAAVAQKLVETHGPIPAPSRPNIEPIRAQTDMMINSIYSSSQPDISVLWFSDPDQTHHYHGVGSVKILSAIRHVDAEFGRLLKWRLSSGLEDRLQVIALSDHGHLTARQRIDVNEEAAKAGFVIGDHFDGEADYAGYTSYSGSLKVRDRNPKRMAAMVDWLSKQSWCGMIFTPGGDGIEGCIPGTFDHASVLMDHPRTPEILYIMRNDDVVFGDGIVGSCFYNGRYPEGGGTHGGLHHKELHILMAAQGTLFKSSYRSHYPAGIIDIAPTILHSLGLEQPKESDGRVLAEALVDSDSELPDAVSTIHTVERNGAVQHLKYTRVGTTVYIDAGWLE